jgi:hypothetical protein
MDSKAFIISSAEILPCDAKFCISLFDFQRFFASSSAKGTPAAVKSLSSFPVSFP